MFRSKRFSNVGSLLVRENHSTKILIDALIFVEKAGILSEHFHRPAKNGPCFAVDGVTMSYCLDVGACLVNGRVLSEQSGLGKIVGSN
jgi:hypothetical protein